MDSLRISWTENLVRDHVLADDTGIESFIRQQAR